MKKSAHQVLAENLNREMNRRHLSHADVAHRTGLSVGAVQEIAAAVAPGDSVGLDKLERIASAFGMTVARFLSPAEPAAADGASARRPEAGTRHAADTTPRQLGRLIEEFFVLPEADRVALLNTASEMASKYRVHITAR